MDIWIRSQNKEQLLKIEEIFIVELLLNGQASIRCNGYNVGIYKSRERALEILDEIEEMISGNRTIEKLNETNSNMNNVFPIIFYEMPKE